MVDKEIRHLKGIEVRDSEETNVPTFEGYVTRFNSVGSVGDFHEQINERAFDNSLKSNNNIFILYNHSWDHILGSTRNESLKLYKDNDGLRFKFTPKADTSYLRDIKELVKNNEISGMSFGFRVNEDTWKTDEEGRDVRTVLDVDLMEVTITPIPFYSSSEVSLRSYEAFKEEQRKAKQTEDDLQLLRLKSNLIKMTNGIK